MRVETRTRKIITRLDSLDAVILRTAMTVVLISAFARFFTSQLPDLGAIFGETKLKEVIAFTVTAVAGVITLSLTLLIFVHFLRAKTKRINELEVKVASAFMKALDESPLKSHALDKRYGKQLDSPQS